MRPFVALLLAVVLSLFFGYLTLEVLAGNTERFDQAVLLALRTGGDPANPLGPAMLEEIARDITALGSYPFLIILFLCLLGYFLLIRQRSLAVLVVATILSGAALNTILKAAIDRPRPDHVVHTARVFSTSFPSAHATLTAVAFLTLGALLAHAHPERGIKVYFMALAIGLTIVVGSSRMYLGVHYPTDVIAGWTVGAAWACVCWAIAVWLRGRHQGRAATDT